VETLRGTPIHTMGRTLVPVARVISTATHRATIRQHTVEGKGSAIVQVRPLQLIELRRDQDIVLPIQDLTARTIIAMALMAVAIALVSVAFIAANRLTASSR
jgi:hypothetical protein